MQFWIAHRPKMMKEVCSVGELHRKFVTLSCLFYNCIGHLYTPDPPHFAVMDWNQCTCINMVIWMRPNAIMYVRSFVPLACASNVKGSAIPIRTNQFACYAAKIFYIWNSVVHSLCRLATLTPQQ